MEWNDHLVAILNARKSNPKIDESVRDSIKSLQAYLPRQEKYLYEENFRSSKFKIKKSEESIDELREIMRSFIEKQRILNSKESLESRNGSLNLERMRFVEDFIPDQKRMKIKYGWDIPNIARNKLQLEHIMLNRLEKFSERNFQELNDDVLVGSYK